MTTDTVKLNVGGRHFEVSRDLIDQHSDTMLGKLVSDTWQEDPEETVFIDRNGDTFAYVLDYLRYGSVDLPITLSKSAFDRDIDFYQIKSTEGSINQESIPQIKDALQQGLHHAKIKHDMFLLALEAQYQYGIKKTISSKFVSVSIPSGHKLYRGEKLREDEQEVFKGYLQTCFGLRLSTFAEGYKCSPSVSGSSFFVTRNE